MHHWLAALEAERSPLTRCAQPKVYNRDGKELGELPKGDMYIRDMKNTKGASAGHWQESGGLASCAQAWRWAPAPWWPPAVAFVAPDDSLRLQVAH